MYQRLVLAMLLCLAIGCSENPKDRPIQIGKVPVPLMDVAKKKLPGVQFDQALHRADGSYEIRGKDKRGKVRDIDLTAAGEVIEIE